MCDRTRVEVLSRELAYCNWVGNRKSIQGNEYPPNAEEWIEDNYAVYTVWAKHLIKLMETHDD